MYIRKNSQYTFFSLVLVLPILVYSQSNNITESRPLENATYFVYEKEYKINPAKLNTDTPENLLATILNCKNFEESEKHIIKDSGYEKYNKVIDVSNASVLIKYEDKKKWGSYYAVPKHKLEFDYRGSRVAIIPLAIYGEGKKKYDHLVVLKKTRKDWQVLFPEGPFEKYADVVRNLKPNHFIALATGTKAKGDDILNETIKYTRDERGGFDMEKFYSLVNFEWRRQGKSHYYDYFMK